MDNEIILLKDCFYVSFLKKKEVQAKLPNNDQHILNIKLFDQLHSSRLTET